ncbi:MAG TPA: hypothetical protein VIK02_00165 [Candidatus Anoxymicrobiaceae bacterium]
MGFMGKKFSKSMDEMADKTSDLGGRTVVEFQSDKNVWEIADAWAAQHDSKPEDQTDTHRKYRFDAGQGLMVGVELDQVDAGFKLQGWMEPPQIGGMTGGIARMAGVPKNLMPTEMRLDAGAAVPGGMVLQNKPGMAFNELLQMLGVEIGIQAVSPQFQQPPPPPA